MPPHVAHVIARMNVGGPAAMIAELVSGLPEQSLLMGDVAEDEADHLVVRGLSTPFTRVPGLGRAPHATDDVRALGFLVRELRRRQPDIVHTHTAKAGVLGRVAARLAGVPHTVHTFHGHLLHGYFSPRVTQAVVLTERRLARRTDRLVAVGEQVKADLLAARIGRPEQYVVIPPGVKVRTPPSRAQARATLGLDQHADVVVHIGRLTAVKRPDRAMAVARLLPHVTFLVAGEGPLYAATMSDAPPNVRFLGWRGDVETVLAAGQACLITSDNEGMPVTAVEAALSGTPTVSTDVGSAREVVVGEVTAADPAALAAALTRVMSDRALGERARTVAKARFSVETMVNAHERLYAEILASDHPG